MKHIVGTGTTTGQIIRKLLLIIPGSIISAYGIDLAIHAGFGGATLAVLWAGIAKTFGITMGQASLLIAAIMILFCLFYSRRQIHVGTILYQVFYSYFVDFFAERLWYTETAIINLLLMIAGIVIFAFGTAMYASADWGRGSYEAVTFAIVEKNHLQVRYVRIALDITVVFLGVLLGGTFGLCTICTILLSGVLIQFFLKKCFSGKSTS